MSKFFRDPIVQHKELNTLKSNTNDILEEIIEIEENIQAGLTVGLTTKLQVSYHLGNNGKFCTFTKECMPSCN